MAHKIGLKDTNDDDVEKAVIKKKRKKFVRFCC